MSRIWEALQHSQIRPVDGLADVGNGRWPHLGVFDRIEETPLGVEVPTDVRSDPAPSTEVDWGAAEQAHLSCVGRVVCQTDPDCPAAESFRLLRMRLREARGARKLQALVVTSPLPEDGKTTVALNLATALVAQRQQRVLLIDADLRRGSVCARLGLASRRGMAEWLEGGSIADAAIRRVEPMGWYLLSAGLAPVANPAELLRPEDLSRLVQTTSAHFDWIVIDSPPLLAYTDAISLAHASDGTVLVGRSGATPNKAIKQAFAALGRKQIVAFVLNGVDAAKQAYCRYYDYSSRGGDHSR